MDGDYYTLQGAKKKIKSLTKYRSREERLIETLTLVNDCHGIHNARQKLMKSTDDPIEKQKILRNFSLSLYELAEMGINPITIPERKAIEYKINHIPNLLKMYEVLESLSAQSDVVVRFGEQ